MGEEAGHEGRGARAVCGGAVDLQGVARQQGVAHCALQAAPTPLPPFFCPSLQPPPFDCRRVPAAAPSPCCLALGPRSPPPSAPPHSALPTTHLHEVLYLPMPCFRCIRCCPTGHQCFPPMPRLHELLSHRPPMVPRHTLTCMRCCPTAHQCPLPMNYLHQTLPHSPQMPSPCPTCMRCCHARVPCHSSHRITPNCTQGSKKGLMLQGFNVTRV